MGEARAFDFFGGQRSYVGPRFLTMGLGLGFSSIAGYSGVSGSPSFGFDLSVGHEFSEELSLDFVYKFSLVGLTSNNPLDITQTIDSTFIFHSQILRILYRYAAYNVQPYVFAGFGIYEFSSVDSKTGMDFAANMQIPLGAGVLAFVYENRLSLKAGIDWHILLGENQDLAVRNLLGVQKISFDVYSLMFTLTWHVF